MKRLVSTEARWESGIPSLEEKIYDSSKDLEYVEEQLAFIAYVSGIEFSSLDELTIDELVEAIRSLYMSFPEGQRDLSSTKWTNNRNYHLLRQVRKFWWHRNLIKGFIANG